ncbi:SRPBCC family protein [Pseudomonas sp. GD03842]|uniref:SRPBCC family protein n=1 Tax=Pseudomonas sp. GD03842 TaxID=2975385 RepID=UPI00244B02F8|nr:SRPBCC family protein [Pseudomonas sp. GD03842]MDH0749395.1 SRPBCC family protein [Pseudomonas sp. GD03842]
MNALNSFSSLKPDTLITNPIGDPVTASVTVPAKASDVWKVVGDFGGFAQFVQALESTDVIGNGVGSIRHKRFKEGGFEVVEQLNSWDEEALAMTWTTLYNNLGVGKLWASMTVTPVSNISSVATWTIIAEPTTDNPMSADEFRAFLQDFADVAMSNVPKLFS